MLYILRDGVFGASLLDTNNNKFESPVKGIKIKIKRAYNGDRCFVIVKDGKIISPLLSRMNIDENVATCDLAEKISLKVDIDLESGYTSPLYRFKKGKLIIDENNIVHYQNNGGEFVDTKLEYKNIDITYSDIYFGVSGNYVGLDNGSGKIAICNADTLFTSPFMFKPGEFSLVADFSKNRDGVEKDICIIQSKLEKEDKTMPIDQDSYFTVLGENGNVIEKIKGSKYLWKKIIEVPTENGTDTFAYIAFKTGVGRKNEATTILKIDTETLELEQTIVVDGVAETKLQPKHLDISVLNDGSLLLVTQKEGKEHDGLGACKVEPNGNVVKLLENDNDKVVIKKDEKGLYIDYKKGTSVGTFALDSAKHEIHTSQDEFKKATRKVVIAGKGSSSPVPEKSLLAILAKHRNDGGETPNGPTPK